MTRNRVQPYKNAIELPYASRKKIQTPPARGIIVASSEQQSAPVIVSKPAIAHASSNQPGAPLSRDDSADVIKMPEPIIDPITIIVASIGPSARTRPEDDRWSAVLLLINDEARMTNDELMTKHKSRTLAEGA